MRYKGRQWCQDFPLSLEKKQSDFLVAVTAGGCAPVMGCRRDRTLLFMMLFSVQSRQMLDGLLLLFGFGFFFIKQKNLTEYYENSFNANIDCSTYLTSKEKARKLDRTTHLPRVEQSFLLQWSCIWKSFQIGFLFLRFLHENFCLFFEQIVINTQKEVWELCKPKKCLKST